MTNASKSRISWEEKLYASDKSLSVEVWSALAKNDHLTIDLDKWSEISYISSTSTGNNLSLSKGRIWVSEIYSPLNITLKNYWVYATTWSILLVEQNWPYSNVYVIQWVVQVATSLGEKDIPPWSMISLLKSDLVNPATQLSDWIQPISGAILEYPLFVRNNWEALIKISSINSWTGSTNTGSTQSWNISIPEANGSKFIEITEPKINTMIKEKTITVMGNLLSKEVKKVTINNLEATISPVNETFVVQNIWITHEVFDIVYKAFDANNTLLQVGVMSVFWSKNAINTTNNSLIPETFPASSKDFKITWPTANPYITTEKFIKVQWIVPKNTVEYIVVNDYKLQKFIPRSGNWYYFANMDTWTMKDWLNLYNIKFYGSDNTLLYSQPFTIIKESKNATISGE
jgi:hypothetical protein